MGLRKQNRQLLDDNEIIAETAARLALKLDEASDLAKSRDEIIRKLRIDIAGERLLNKELIHDLEQSGKITYKQTEIIQALRVEHGQDMDVAQKLRYRVSELERVNAKPKKKKVKIYYPWKF